ncbi:hypothetical protein K435DRAFT_964169 [Dendrothele bispora CBS 962.96]|uniref:Uncharacterized protein n=1 Tax=Dendrothele bispora (strain CBS 962.96) TaxID=1314807 RepID=A0A4V4HGU0_DENBC|nr:hypothetical protein K435DRAFT_964169 [Dendrothele bispora CBS 962.96]
MSSISALINNFPVLYQLLHNLVALSPFHSSSDHLASPSLSTSPIAPHPTRQSSLSTISLLPYRAHLRLCCQKKSREGEGQFLRMSRSQYAVDEKMLHNNYFQPTFSYNPVLLHPLPGSQDDPQYPYPDQNQRASPQVNSFHHLHESNASSLDEAVAADLLFDGIVAPLPVPFGDQSERKRKFWPTTRTCVIVRSGCTSNDTLFAISIPEGVERDEFLRAGGDERERDVEAGEELYWVLFL